MIMQFFTGKNSWPPDRSSASEKRKHESVDSPLDEEGRKRPRAESAVSNRDDRHRQESEGRLHSPSTSDALRSPITQNSLPTPPIHPDRLQMFTPRSASHYNTSNKLPPSPLSRSPEHSLEAFAADEPNSPKIHHSNPVWRSKSRRSSDELSHPQPLQIDTARASSELDPRSPGYTAHGMPSEFRVKGASLQQHSRDADRPPLDTHSRRESATMPPPTSATIRPPRSESSTPKISTPISVSEPMNPASAAFNSSGHYKNTFKGFSITSHGKEVALPKATAPRYQTTLAPDYIGFAQSIMATTSVNMKLENVKELASENVKESRRHEKHNVAYASLVDHINSHHGAIQRAKTRLEKQFERCNKEQDQITNTLQAHVAQLPAAYLGDAAIRTNVEVPEKLVALQEELRKIKDELANQKDRYVSQEGLEKEIARKFVRFKDIEQLAPREELLSVGAKLSSHTSDVRRLEIKIAELATVANERHDKAQETQKEHDHRIRYLDSEMSTARNTSEQSHTNTQIKLAELESDIGSLRRDLSTQTELADVLEKNVDAWKEDSASIKAGFEQLKSAQSSLKAFVQGDSVNSELGLSNVIEEATNEISQMKLLVEQLREKIVKLEEEATEDSASVHRQSAPIDNNDRNRRIDGIEQDVTEIKGAIDDLKGEFCIIAEDLDKIRKGFTNITEEHGRLKEGIRKQQSVPSQTLQPRSQAPTPAYTNGLVSIKSSDHIKLEKLENDVQALDVVMKTQQQRFDNLTTEDMARSIIHQTKLLYKEHPAHVQDKLRALEEQQLKVDRYITNNLQPKLLQMIDVQISLRAGMDAFHSLYSRVQALEANPKEADFQLRRNLSEGTTGALIPHDQGPHNTKIREVLSALREELEEVRSKHAELVDMVMTRHGKLRGDVQILNMEMYTGAAGNPHKQAQLRELLEYLDLTKLDTGEGERTESGQGGGLNKEMISRAPVASMSPSRQGSVPNGRDRHRSASSNESDTPMSQLQARKRKRRRSQPSIIDDEDDDDDDVRRRAAGKGLR